jgi:hypothetical protein
VTPTQNLLYGTAVRTLILPQAREQGQDKLRFVRRIAPDRGLSSLFFQRNSPVWRNLRPSQAGLEG